MSTSSTMPRCAALALALAMGCAPAPAPLPEPVAAPGEARRVRVPGVDGYLARPAGARAQGPAVLLQVDALNPDTQAAARQAAVGGAVVLALGPDSDLLRARAYLEGMPDTTTVTVECRAEWCR